MTADGAGHHSSPRRHRGRAGGSRAQLLMTGLETTDPPPSGCSSARARRSGRRASARPGPPAAATLGVVGDQDDRLAAAVQPAQQLEDLMPALGVQRAGRLVGQQQASAGSPGRGRSPPAGAGRPTARPACRGALGHAEQVEQSSGPGLGHPAPAARRCRRQRHVLQHGHALDQIEELEDHARLAAAQPGQVVLAAAGELLPAS